jgi:hypothetical protein
MRGGGSSCRVTSGNGRRTSETRPLRASPCSSPYSSRDPRPPVDPVVRHHRSLLQKALDRANSRVAARGDSAVGAGAILEAAQRRLRLSPRVHPGIRGRSGDSPQQLPAMLPARAGCLVRPLWIHNSVQATLCFTCAHRSPQRTHPAAAADAPRKTTDCAVEAELASEPPIANSVPNPCRR